MITGTLRNILTLHFSSADNIEDPALRRSDSDSSTGFNADAAIWREGAPTGILIESVFRWRGELVEMRPAVLIKRNAYRNLRITIADRGGVDKRGFQQYVTIWVGSHTIFCIHRTGASAEILATEVQREITQFAPVVQSKMGLMKFQVTEVEPVGVLEESTQDFVVPIVIGWAYQETWSLQQHSLPLTAIVTKISPELRASI